MKQMTYIIYDLKACNKNNHEKKPLHTNNQKKSNDYKPESPPKAEIQVIAQHLYCRKKSRNMSIRH